MGMKNIKTIKCIFDSVPSIYEGETLNGKFHGKGTLKSKISIYQYKLYNLKGIYYKGNFKNNKLDGDGIYINSINKFNNNHIDGTMKSKELKIYKNYIKKYSVPFESDLDMSYFYINSDDIIVGTFKNNKIHGTAEILSSNKDYAKVNFDNGKLHGIAHFVNEEGLPWSTVKWTKGFVINNNGEINDEPHTPEYPYDSELNVEKAKKDFSAYNKAVKDIEKKLEKIN